MEGLKLTFKVIVLLSVQKCFYPVLYWILSRLVALQMFSCQYIQPPAKFLLHMHRITSTFSRRIDSGIYYLPLFASAFSSILKAQNSILKNP